MVRLAWQVSEQDRCACPVGPAGRLAGAMAGAWQGAVLLGRADEYSRMVIIPAITRLGSELANS